MTDYSKPIGWWCPHCGYLTRGDERQDAMAALLRGTLKGPVIAWMHTSGCTRGDHADTVPVFAEIPEGERPQTTWDEPEVCTAFWPNGTASVENGDRLRSVRGERHGIGDAVLWVVEGKRP